MLFAETIKVEASSSICEAVEPFGREAGPAADPRAECADLSTLLREDIRLGVGQLLRDLRVLGSDAKAAERALAELDAAGRMLASHARGADRRWTGETIDLARGGAPVAVETVFERPPIGGCARLELADLGTFRARIEAARTRRDCLVATPTPEIREIDAPITIAGRPWGVFRLGVRPTGLQARNAAGA